MAITSYLVESERIIWTGRPPTGILFRKSDGLLIPMSLLWGGFAMFWEYTAYTSGAPAIFLLFGGVFVIFGLFLAFGRFVYDMWMREDTIYALTNERILVLAGLFGHSLRAMNLKTLPQVSLELSDNGKGTITFGTPGGFGFGAYRPYWPGLGKMSPLMFERIDDAGEVLKLIQSSTRQ